MTTDEYSAQIYRVLASQLLDPAVTPSDIHRSLLELSYVVAVAIARYEDTLPQVTIDRVHTAVQEEVERSFAEADTVLQRFFENMGY